jgi:hypothetical protein
MEFEATSSPRDRDFFGLQQKPAQFSIVPEYVDRDSSSDEMDLALFDSSLSSADSCSSDEEADTLTVINQPPPAQTPTSQEGNSHSPTGTESAGPVYTFSNPLELESGTTRTATSQEYSSAPRPLEGGFRPSTGRILKYAMDLRSAPIRMQEFLAELKSHFTKEVNLERNTPPVTKNTFLKTQERLLCEYYST